MISINTPTDSVYVPHHTHRYQTCDKDRMGLVVVVVVVVVVVRILPRSSENEQIRGSCPPIALLHSLQTLLYYYYYYYYNYNNYYYNNRLTGESPHYPPMAHPSILVVVSLQGQEK